jgi:hypothetical protein
VSPADGIGLRRPDVVLIRPAERPRPSWSPTDLCLDSSQPAINSLSLSSVITLSVRVRSRGSGPQPGGDGPGWRLWPDLKTHRLRRKSSPVARWTVMTLALRRDAGRQMWRLTRGTHVRSEMSLILRGIVSIGWVAAGRGCRWRSKRPPVREVFRDDAASTEVLRAIVLSGCRVCGGQPHDPRISDGAGSLSDHPVNGHAKCLPNEHQSRRARRLVRHLVHDDAAYLVCRGGRSIASHHMSVRWFR